MVDIQHPKCRHPGCGAKMQRSHVRISQKWKSVGWYCPVCGRFANEVELQKPVVPLLMPAIKQGMDEIEDSTIDLTVTFPPYANGAVNIEKTISDLMRVTKPGGVVVWITADKVVDGFETADVIKHSFQFRDIGFWRYDTMLYLRPGIVPTDDGPRYERTTEYMFIFSKGKPKTFNCIKDVPKHWEGSWCKIATQRQKDGTLKRNYHPSVGKGKVKDITGKFGWKSRANVWSYTDVDKETARYFLVEDHIRSWSNAGDTILDPFNTDEVVGIAAKRNKRNCLLVDYIS